MRIRSGDLERLGSSRHGRRLLHLLAVDLDRVAACVAAPVPPRVVKDRVQPRAEVRAALELPGKPERLDEGVLYEILRVGAVPRQPHRRGEQRLEKLKRLGGKRIRVRGGW